MRLKIRITPFEFAMNWDWSVIIGALGAFTGLSLDKVFRKKIGRPALSYLLALLVTVVLFGILAFFVKSVIQGCPVE